MYKQWIEPVKTVSLIFLILLSLVLTTLLWFFTPFYMKDDKNHIDSPKIGEAQYNQKSRYQLTGPPILYLHVTGNHYWLTPNEPSYDALLRAISQSKLTSFRQIQPTPEQWQTLFQTSYGVEFSFFHDLPINQVDAFFDQNLGMQPLLANLNRISRIWLFVDEKSDQTTIWFISDQEQKIISAITDITGENFRKQIKAAEQQIRFSPTLVPVSTTNKLPWDPANKGEPFPRILYLPEQPVTVKQYIYAPKEIPIETMKLALLQTNVEEIELKDEMIFIWNDLMLTYNKKTKNMLYSDEPNSDTVQENTISVDIVNINDSFMEKHYGWTGNFLLEKYEQPEKRNLYTFRLIHEGFPVFWYRDENDVLHFDRILLQAEPSNVNGIGKYRRSLVTLSSKPVSEKNAALPSMTQFLQLLEKEKIPLTSIQRVYPAYQAIPKGKYFELVPVWRVEDASGKQWMIGGKE